MLQQKAKWQAMRYGGLFVLFLWRLDSDCMNQAFKLSEK